MRIAFVSQPFDAVNPDALNSVGLVTHHLAAELAPEHDVVVYGSLGCAGNQGAWDGTPGVAYRLVPATRRDRLVTAGWTHLAPWRGALRHGLRPPLSTGAAVGRDYGRAVAADLRRERVDVVHVQHATQLLPAIRAAAPDATVVLHAHAHWFPQTPAGVLADRLRHADLVVTCSDFVRREIVAYVPQLEGRAVTVHNGVDTALTDARAPLAATRDLRPFLLSLGALSPHKGVHDTIAAFTRLAPDRPELDLRIVGPSGIYPMEESFPLDDRALVRRLRPLYRGDYGQHLRSLVPPELSGRVIFEGRLPVEQVTDRLLGARALVFPSLWDEGFGLPALEALAAGTPVVATPSGGVPEFVQDGRTGRLADKGDPDGLAAAIGSLLSDDAGRARLGTAGWSLARERFAWPVIADRLLAAYASSSSTRVAAG